MVRRPSHRDTPEQRAWYWYDFANSAFYTTTAAVLFGPYLTTLAKRAACPGADTSLACHTDLHVLGIPVAPGSLSSYVTTVTTIVSAVLLVLVGVVADRSRRPHRLLGGFAWLGSLAASLMVLLHGGTWQLAVALYVVASLAIASSLVVYDALLVRIAAPGDRDRVSSRGWAFGYVGGATLLAANLALLTLKPFGLDTEGAVRVSLLSAGVWWAVFTVIPVLGLQRVGGFVDEAGAPPASEPTFRGAFARLVSTARDLRHYPQTMLFLAAALFFNDGVQSVIASASVYGAEELGMGQSTIMVTFLVVQVVAIAGALGFGRLAASVGAQKAVLWSLGAWTIVVVVGYVLPAHRVPAFMVLGALIGIVMGGTQALSRSLYSQLVPAGREAEYFSLYQALERGTSWFGTAAFGIVHQMTGSYRPSILVLVTFFVVGGLLLARMDVGKGMRDAGQAHPAGS